MFSIFLIIFNILIFFILNKEHSALLGLNALFFEGEYYQVLSSMFIHANATHLILNMIVLFQFGFILEKRLGSVYFAFVYLVGGILCSLLSLGVVYYELMQARLINVVGASGAICVLMGYYAVLDKNSTKGLIVAILLMSFVPLMMGVNVAWYGHIFGFVCGYILAKLARR